MLDLTSGNLCGPFDSNRSTIRHATQIYAPLRQRPLWAFPIDHPFRKKQQPAISAIATRLPEAASPLSSPSRPFRNRPVADIGSGMARTANASAARLSFASFVGPTRAITASRQPCGSHPVVGGSSTGRIYEAAGDRQRRGGGNEAGALHDRHAAESEAVGDQDLSGCIRPIKADNRPPCARGPEPVGHCGCGMCDGWDRAPAVDC